MNKQIVVDYYFERECNENTSIKEAFTKGFELGLKEAPIPTKNRNNENLYPIFIKKNGKDYCVFIPDLQGYTDETTIEKAIESAKEYIRNIRELRGGYLVPPSNVEEAINKAKKDANDIFDYSDGLLVYVKI